MNFAELFVRYRVLAYMISLAVVLFGVIGLRGIGVDRLPSIETPLVMVTTSSPGATPEIIDSSITNVLESAINTVSGLIKIQSISSPGRSQIVIEFELDKGSDAAFNEVQAKVNQVINDLPIDAKVPVVSKVDPNAFPVLWLFMQGDRDLAALDSLARDHVKKKLETVSGVGEVSVGGGRDRKMRIDLDLQKMAALNVTVDDVLQAFAREHVQLPGGYLVGGMLEKLLHLDLEYHSDRELKSMVVMWRDQVPVKLEDIADVSDSLDEMRSVARLNGVDGVAIAVQKVQNANTVKIVDEVEKRLDSEIKPSLPDGVQLSIAVNEADIIRGTVEGLQTHIIEGTVLAALVVWLFLLNVPSTLIVSAAIPVSLAGSLIFMHINGYTFNILTLSALLLLIGVVVDDAIVVLENIHRKQEQGMDARQAAITGTKEVVFAVLAASLTLVCIFASVIFMEGMVGVFLGSFAVVVTTGVIASMLISLSMTPALCASFLKPAEKKQKKGLVLKLEQFHQRIETGYRRILQYSLGHRAKILIGTFVIILSTGWIFTQISAEMFPKEDDARFVVDIKAPLGSSVNYMMVKMDQVEAVIRQQPEVSRILGTINSGGRGEVNRASLKVLLSRVEDRNRSQARIMAQLRGELALVPGIEAYVKDFSILENLDSQPLTAFVIGPDLEGVAKYSTELHQRLLSVGGMGNLRLELELNRPQLKIDIDRERAHALGIDTRQIGNTIRVLAGGADIAKYNAQSGDGERYDVRLAAREDLLNDSRDLEQVYLRTGEGKLVPLSAVSTIEETFGPASVDRVNMSIGARLSSTPEMALGDAIKVLRSTAAEILPAGYGISLVGESDKFEETSANIVFVFVTGLIMVYMVLASQFNSFLQPLLVMLAQPLAIVGGVFALWLTGNSLNIYSMIGMFLLVGLVSKNSILLVDLINRYRREGMTTEQAIHQACPERMRPVLMTSLTIVLALLPAAMGIGQGSGQYGPLSVAVIGGVVSSTGLTLIIIPVAYSLMVRWLGNTSVEDGVIST